MAVHFFYYEAAALIVEGFSAGGKFLEAGEDEAGEGFVAFVLRKDDIVLAFEVADVDRSVESEGGIGVDGGRSGGDVEFIFEFADELLEHIFYADDSGGRSEFIDHHCEVALALLEFH